MFTYPPRPPLPLPPGTVMVRSRFWVWVAFATRAQLALFSAERTGSASERFLPLLAGAGFVLHCYWVGSSDFQLFGKSSWVFNTKPTKSGYNCLQSRYGNTTVDSLPEFMNFKLFGKTILVAILKFEPFLGHPLSQ